MKKDFLAIINLKRPPSKHPKMSIYDRSAQFSPFAALTGHNEAILETARLTEKRKILDQQQIQILNQQLNFLINDISKKHQITITYFKADGLKDGGRYLKVTSYITKANLYDKYILLESGEKIAFSDLYLIDGDCFSSNS